MIRLDYSIIADIIQPGTKVLDLGCGDGELLSLLKEQRHCRGTGIEIDNKAVVRCLERGVSVSHGNINGDMGVYGDKRFDYVIMNESLQQLLNIEQALDEALRVGKRVIVGVPNFCQWQARLQVFFRGEMPVTDRLPFKWYNTPNLRFLSLKDFSTFCENKKISIEKARFMSKGKEVFFLPNLTADSAIFVLTRDKKF